MSGEAKSTKSASANELAKQVDELLREYELGLGINNINPNIPAERYLTMSEDEMKTMTGEDAARASIVLAQYSFYLQRSINVETRRVTWANGQIDRAILSKMKNYNASSAPERRALAIEENDFAKSLESLRNQAQARVDQINYLSSKVDALSYRYSEYQQAKRQKNNL